MEQKTLDISVARGSVHKLRLPLSSATKTFAVLAKRGAGKTYTASVMAEEMHKAGIPFVVFDPIDVWWGLRLNKDGKSEGLPIVVFGLEHADIKLERDMGAQIAQSIVKHNISCVISTFGMPKVGQRQLIAEFAEELLRINNTPRHVFIEEAHEFVPQRVFGAMGRVFAAVEALVVMGRNRGIGVTLINQRAATINKDVLTQLDTLLAFRNVAPQDRKALSEWVEAHSADGDFDKFMKSLPSLPTGEGWIWSPEFLEMFQRVIIRKRETFHPDREKLGVDFEMPDIERIDIQAFVEEFGKIKKTEEKGGKKKDVIGIAVSPTEVAIDVQKLKNDYESQLVAKDTVINALTSKLRQISLIAGGSEERISGSTMTIAPHVPIAGEENLMLQKLGGMARNVYTRLMQHPNGLSKQQIALMCGYASTSGSLRNALSKLKTMGLVKRDGDIYRVVLS